jgi:DNA polymerase-3 subunit gamma/tau
MTSQVFYRKWRPLSFKELAGQEPVAATLRQAVNLGRVAHSYLFCGPRGTGKTTTARIVAKAVNCLDLQDGDPCNKCQVCETINGGQFMDIIEMDAASNRGIDEIRDIREKVNFAPVQGRRKVYIIDEAHMLTDQASNAFLKTLEEPPAHVMFILCTTEAHKIIPTIVSRCQRFDFRRIPSGVIYQRLDEISRAEGASIDSDALRLVARYAEGSLRDAENLLEQLVVSYGDGVSLAQVEELLGLGNSERWLELARYLLMGNTNGALDVVNQAAWDGTDMRQLHRQTLELLRAAMLLQWGSASMVDLPDHITSQLQDLVGQLPAWRIMQALKLWGEVNMRYDAPSTLPLELAAVEICDAQAAAPAAQAPAAPTPAAAPALTRAVPEQRPQPKPAPRPEATPVDPAPVDARPAEPVVAPHADMPIQAEAQTTAQSTAQSTETVPAAAAVSQEAGPPAPDPVSGDFETQWLATVRDLGRYKGKKYNLGALLRDCRSGSVALEGDTLVLPFAHRAHLERMQEEFDDPVGKKKVADSVLKHFGVAYDFRLTLAGDGHGGETVKPSQNSTLVRTAMGMGARILEEIAE